MDYHTLFRTYPKPAQLASSQQLRENFDKLLSNRTFLCRLVMGSVGGSDILVKDAVVADVSVSWVSDNQDGSAPYTVTVDYTITLSGSDVVVNWSPGGAEPTAGDVYWVKIVYTPTYSVSATGLANDTQFTLAVTDGFNPESTVRREQSRITGTPDEGSPLFTKLVFKPNNVDVGNDNKCRHIRIENDTTGEYHTLLLDTLTHEVFGDALTGTADNYCEYRWEWISGQYIGKIKYKDDFDSDGGGATEKWDIDCARSSGAVHDVPNDEIDVSNGGYFGYHLFFPGRLKNIDITVTNASNDGKIRISNGQELRSLGTTAAMRSVSGEDFLCQDVIYVEFYNDSGGARSINDFTIELDYYPSSQLPILVDGTNNLKFHIVNTDESAAPSGNLSCDYEVEAEVASYRTKQEDRYERLMQAAESTGKMNVFNPPSSTSWLGGAADVGGVPWNRLNAENINAENINTQTILDVCFFADEYGTGKTNVEIQAALTAAGAAGGGTVYLSAGTWTLSNHITMPANTILTGTIGSVITGNYIITLGTGCRVYNIKLQGCMLYTATDTIISDCIFVRDGWCINLVSSNVVIHRNTFRPATTHTSAAVDHSNGTYYNIDVSHNYCEKSLLEMDGSANLIRAHISHNICSLSTAGQYMIKMAYTDTGATLQYANISHNFVQAGTGVYTIVGGRSGGGYTAQILDSVISNNIFYADNYPVVIGQSATYTNDLELHDVIFNGNRVKGTFFAMSGQTATDVLITNNGYTALGTTAGQVYGDVGTAGNHGHNEVM